MNQKSKAWDVIGGQFWEKGRESAKPSENELNILTEGISSEDTCLVIGASTKSLIERVLTLTDKLIVVDFSERMCADLLKAVPGVDVILQDITTDVDKALCNKADWIISERLINRMDEVEATVAFTNMQKMLKPTGTIRTTVWLGLYPMDEIMIEQAKDKGCLEDIWDSGTNTINFSGSSEVLQSALVSHGSIDHEDLLKWYIGRGKEKRFSEQEITDILVSNNFKFINISRMPDSSQSVLFTARKN